VQHLRQQSGPGWTPTRRAAAEAGQGVSMNLLGVIAGEDARTRGPTPRGIVELGKTQAVLGQSIEVRRANLTAVAAGVRKAMSSATMTRKLGLAGAGAAEASARSAGPAIKESPARTNVRRVTLRIMI